MIRLGLCCLFVKQPIRFRSGTATFLTRLKKRGEDPYCYLDEIIGKNISSLKRAIEFCAEVGIGSFRVGSHFFPIATHPDWKYSLEDLPNGSIWVKELAACKRLALAKGIRLTFHPNQFVVLNALDRKVRDNSIEELEYHAQLASLIGADVITVHGGGGYGDKKESLKRLERVLSSLPKQIKALITLENDEKVFSPVQLIPLCLKTGVPFVYDVHHHRCLPDEWSEEEATKQALRTWNREPLFHVSSPLEGWKGPKPFRHHDYIDIRDVPECWKEISELTIDVEAKAKELAVLKLKKQLLKRGWLF